jgi:chemotaxis protein histidine kinase CheA
VAALLCLCIELSGEKEMAEPTAEENANQSKPGESKPDQANPDQSHQEKSNPDQSRSDKPNPDQSSPDNQSPDKSVPDKKVPDKPGPEKTVPEKSSQDQSALDHAKIDKLVAVNRELAIYLEEQLDTVLALRQSVAAIERALAGNAVMKKRYEKCLQSVKDEGQGLPDIPWINRIRGVLSRLQRTGTL